MHQRQVRVCAPPQLGTSGITAINFFTMRRVEQSTFERLLISYARRFPIQRGKLRAIDALWRVAAGNRGVSRMAELKYGGFKMPCNLNEMLQRQYYFFGTYFLEDYILECWQIAAKGAKVIFDVGANAGIYSLAALASQRAAIIHAFEPTPEIAARLRATANLNRLGKLYIHEVAVSSDNGYATLIRCRGELGTNDGMNFICRDQAESDGDVVKTVCLDWFCEYHSIDRIDLLKLDIQGHEYSALMGAESLIRAGRIGMIFMELNWADETSSVLASESIRLLERAGYCFSRAGRCLKWEKAGDWLRALSDVVARKA
jgi:FkbM family methyltransferase